MLRLTKIQTMEVSMPSAKQMAQKEMRRSENDARMTEAVEQGT